MKDKAENKSKSKSKSKSKPKPKKKMGRPKKKIDWKVFDELCALQCTAVEIALEFNMDITTLNERIKEKFDGQTFSDVFAIKRMNGIKSLRRRMYESSIKNPVLQMYIDKKYGHLQGDVDQRHYGGKTAESESEDRQIDISIKIVDLPPEAIKERLSVDESLKIKERLDEYNGK